MEKNNPDLLIVNALVVNEGTEHIGYVAVEGRLIAATGAGAPPADLAAGASRVIDARGGMLMPGVIDTHVHFRDPGLTQKADFASESKAAVEGGVTSVIDMPNTNPATVTLDAFEQKMEMAAEKSHCNYGFFIGATNTNIEELRRADYSRVAGVKLFLGSSTGNMLVDRREMLDSLFSSVPQALIAVHAESESEVAANRRAFSERYADRGTVPLECHPLIRSRKACVDAARLAIDMAVTHRHPLHLLHISTADELDLLTDEARRYVTAETAPHYLFFDDADYARLGTRVKCNPAIKCASDRRALIGAVADGRIDTIATDHAPHLPADKEGDALTAASGMPGIRFSLQVMLEIARREQIPASRIVELMCHAPARTLRIDRRGFIRPGYYADLTLVDNCPDSPVVVSDADAGGKCGWTPYAGSELHSRVLLTLVNGSTAFAAPSLAAEAAPVSVDAMPLRYLA